MTFMAGLAGSLLLGGTLMSAFSKYQEGKLSEEMYKANRAIGLRHAKVIRDIFNYKIGRYLSNAAKGLHKFKSVAAKANLEVSGTISDVGETVWKKVLEEKTMMEYDRDISTWKIETGAAMQGAIGSAQRASSEFSALATLITGGAKFAGIAHEGGWFDSNTTWAESMNTKALSWLDEGVS